MAKAKATPKPNINNNHNADPVDGTGTVPTPRPKKPPTIHFETENYYYSKRERVINLPIRPPHLSKIESDKFRDVLKKNVMKLEEINFNQIILYHRGDGWWQIGGSSLLFYKYYLQDEYGLTNINLRRDNDFGCRWPAGYDVAMIRSIDNFCDNMRKAHAELILSAPELRIFKLTKSFSEHDVAAFHNIKAAKLAHINTLLTPKISHPHIKQSIDNLTTFVVNRIEKLSPFQRDLYGIKGADALLKISYRFFMMSDGDINDEEYYVYALSQLKYFMTWLAFTQKFNIFNIDELNRLANECVDLKERFQNELIKIRKTL